MLMHGFIVEKDWNFLNSGKYGRCIEIDNVLAYVGAERFWQEIVIKKFGELFPRRDYRRSIDVPESITPPMQATIDFVHGQVKDLLKLEYEKSMSKLKNYEGFIMDVAQKEYAIRYRMHEIVKESKPLMSLLEEIEALRIKYNSNP